MELSALFFVQISTFKAKFSGIHEFPVFRSRRIGPLVG